MAGEDDSGRRGMMKAGWEWAFGVARSDFSVKELPELDWGSGQASESLSKVYKHASDQCSDAFIWYSRSIRGKRRGAVSLRLGAIAARTADLLIVGFETTGKGGMYHRTNIRLVHSHAERDGGDNHLQRSRQEFRLDAFSFF